MDKNPTNHTKAPPPENKKTQMFKLERLWYSILNVLLYYTAVQLQYSKTATKWARYMNNVTNTITYMREKSTFTNTNQISTDQPA